MSPRHLALSCFVGAAACGAEDLAWEPPAPALHPVQDLGASLSPAELRVARARLRSGDERQIAWGAYAAGEAQTGELVPDLVKALRAALAEGGEDAFLWDALLRLEAEVPPDLVRWAVREGSVQGLVSAVLHPAAHEASLLDVIEADVARTWRWKTAANRLSQTRSRAFTASLLDSIVVDVLVVECGVGFGGGYGYSSCGGHYVNIGTPPRAVYRLVEAGEREDCWLTVPGPRPACVTRATYGGGAEPPAPPSEPAGLREVALPPLPEAAPLELGGYERDEDIEVRLDYLAALAGLRRDELDLAARTVVQLPCGGDGRQEDDVTAEVVRLEHAFSELQEALRSAGVLAEDTSFPLGVNLRR